MQVIWGIAMIGLLLSGGAVQAKQRGIAISTTLVNYKTGAIVRVDGGRTDRGSRLPFKVSLIDSSSLTEGATSGSPDLEPGLPEWVELTWTEDRRPALSTKEWFALDEAARQARGDQLRSLPLKSARVAVRSLVPASVIEELEQAPPDPTRSGLRLKSMNLQFIWTRDGVKVRWIAYQGCCTIIHEGGDTVRLP